jgi:pimeloyl-ACP methyl ester carboxylesterase
MQLYPRTVMSILVAMAVLLISTLVLFAILLFLSPGNPRPFLDERGTWRAKIFSGSYLWNAQLSTDLAKKVTRLKVPVYFFHGAYDYTVSYHLGKSYYEQLDAPVKGFYTFKNSAHSPLFEEPGRISILSKGR